MKKGDVVMFSREHLKSTWRRSDGQYPSSRERLLKKLGLLEAVGTVLEVDTQKRYQLVTIDFDRYISNLYPDMFGGPLGVTKALASNLILKSERHLEHA